MLLYHVYLGQANYCLMSVNISIPIQYSLKSDSFFFKYRYLYLDKHPIDTTITNYNIIIIYIQMLGLKTLHK